MKRPGQLTTVAAAAIAALFRGTDAAPAQPAEVMDQALAQTHHVSVRGPRSRLATLRKRTVQLLTAPAGRKLATVTPVTEFGSPRVLSVVQQRRGWLGVITSGLPN